MLLGCSEAEGVHPQASGTGGAAAWIASMAGNGGDCVEAGTGFVRVVRKDAFWRDERGLHVVYPEQEGIVVESFDAASGELVRRREYAPWPSELVGEVPSQAGAPDGSFVALFRYRPPEDALPTDGVLIGHLDQEESTAWSPPWTFEEGGLLHAAWDGEAFRLHARGPDGELRLARLSTTGELILPLTPVGRAGAFTYDHWEDTADPQSGISLKVGIGAPGVYLVGHERDGELLPAVAANGFAHVGPTEGVGVGSAVVSVALGGEGAMVSYDGPEYCTVVQRLDLSPAPVSEPIEMDCYQTVFGEREFSFGTTALAFHGGHWWLAGDSGVGLELLKLSDTHVVERRDFVLHSLAECVATDSCPMILRRQFRDLDFIAWDDELWLGFLDLSGNTDPGQRYRIVRVLDDCHYLADRDR
jgi:hypothetical protein